MGGNQWTELIRSFVVLDTVVLKLSLFAVPKDPADSTCSGIHSVPSFPDREVLPQDQRGGKSVHAGSQ